METKLTDIMTDEEYFALKAISASQIKQYDKGAYYFWQSSPFNPQKEPETDSDALAFGKLCHAFVLGNGKTDGSFAVAEFGASRKNKKYTEAKEQYPGLTVVNGDEWRHAQMMWLKILQHPLAAAILDGATAEMPYTWTDKETGLPCKMKCDAVKRTKSGLVVIDYKTSSDIESLLYRPQKLQYPLQDDFYCRGIKEKYGEEPAEFVFIIQSSKEGEEDVIAVANVDPVSRQIAHTIVSHHMTEINEKLKQWEKTHNPAIWAAYPDRMIMRYPEYY